MVFEFSVDSVSKRNPKANKKQVPDKASQSARSAESVDSSRPYFIEVDEQHAEQRLDNFLFTHLKGVPKTRIYRIIRKGELRVNKGRVKQTTRLKAGDQIRIPPLRQSQDKSGQLDGSRFEFLNAAILYEDDDLLVINKPSGMAVHAGSGIRVGVIEALRALRTDLAYLELAHRLDRETSGCLILAKKSRVLKSLNADFKHNSLKNPRLDKRYLALVRGNWAQGTKRITKPLDTQARRSGERIVVVKEGASYASSIVKPLANSGTASLLEVKLLTGRTHQVRVHTQSEGFPIAGDQRYGDRVFNNAMKKLGLSRLFLHAAKITFFHPTTTESIAIEAPLPQDLTAVLETLELATL